MRRVLVIVLIIVVFSFCNVLAVQVSDNDGSAFITKAEFDSLKNNFQAQLDRYFSSIDNKIDDAIAQYLAGVKVESVSYPDNFVKKINFSTTGGFMPLAKKWTKPNTNKPVNGLLALMAAFTLKNSSGNATWNGMATVGVSLQSGSGVVRDTVNWQDRPSTRTNAKYFMLDIDNGRNYVNNEVKEIEYKMSVLGEGNGYGNSAGSQAYNLKGLSFDEIKNESSIWVPVKKTLTVIADCRWSPDEVLDRGYNIVCAVAPSWQEITSTETILPIVGSFGTSEKMFCLDYNKINKMVVSDTESSMNTRVYGMFLTRQADATSFTDAKTVQTTYPFSWYYNYHEYDEVLLTSFSNKTMTQLVSNTVYYYNGLPITKCTLKGELSFDLTLESASGGDVYFSLKKNSFSNDAQYNLDTTLNVRKVDGSAFSQTATSGTTLSLKMDVEPNDIIWIKCYDVTSDEGLTSVDVDNLKIVSNT